MHSFKLYKLSAYSLCWSNYLRLDNRYCKEGSSGCRNVDSLTNTGCNFIQLCGRCFSYEFIKNTTSLGYQQRSIQDNTNKTNSEYHCVGTNISKNWLISATD